MLKLPPELQRILMLEFMDFSDVYALRFVCRALLPVANAVLVEMVAKHIGRDHDVFWLLNQRALACDTLLYYDDDDQDQYLILKWLSVGRLLKLAGVPCDGMVAHQLARRVPCKERGNFVRGWQINVRSLQLLIDSLCTPSDVDLGEPVDPDMTWPGLTRDMDAEPDINEANPVVLPGDNYRGEPEIADLLSYCGMSAAAKSEALLNTWSLDEKHRWFLIWSAEGVGRPGNWLNPVFVRFQMDRVYRKIHGTALLAVNDDMRSSPRDHENTWTLVAHIFIFLKDVRIPGNTVACFLTDWLWSPYWTIQLHDIECRGLMTSILNQSDWFLQFFSNVGTRKLSQNYGHQVDVPRFERFFRALVENPENYNRNERMLLQSANGIAKLLLKATDQSLRWDLIRRWIKISGRWTDVLATAMVGLYRREPTVGVREVEKFKEFAGLILEGGMDEVRTSPDLALLLIGILERDPPPSRRNSPVRVSRRRLLVKKILLTLFESDTAATTFSPQVRQRLFKELLQAASADFYPERTPDSRPKRLALLGCILVSFCTRNMGIGDLVNLLRSANVLDKFASRREASYLLGGMFLSMNPFESLERFDTIALEAGAREFFGVAVDDPVLDVPGVSF